MKLWIDDMRDAPDESWTLVRKVLPAIRLIAMHMPEEISLDHDIENRPDDETFLPIAYFIGALHGQIDFPNDWKVKVTIHSINPVGAKEMQQVLRDFGVASTYEPYKLAEFNKKWGLE